MNIKQKKQRINDKKEELLIIFQSLDANKLKTAMPLIERVAWTVVEVEELEAIIQKDGWVEGYQNGENQKGMKRSANADVYLQLRKVFSADIKKLIDLCPDSESASAINEMMREFD